MLDISIPSVHKALKTEEKRNALMHRHVTVVEKFDGTKLTLFRNFLPRNVDYVKNWTVSYKGNVIYPEESLYVNGNLDRSIGVSQYKRVFDHLRSVPFENDVPMGLELFVEFIQNKPTLTRDYDSFGDMFLIGHAFCDSVTLGMRTYTTSESLQTNNNSVYAKSLGLKLPPVLFEGRLVNEFGTYDTMKLSYENMKSTLGGKAEGVVIRDSGELMKVVASDQYDRDVRKAKKLRYAFEDKTAEDAYWKMIRHQATLIVDKHWSDSAPEMMKRLGAYIYFLDKDEFFATNPKKDVVVLRDDLMLTAKMVYEETLDFRAVKGTRVAVIPLAGRPFHEGHSILVKNAQKENDVVFLFVSTKSRGLPGEKIQAGTMMQVWRRVLLPNLPKDGSVVVRFVDSPVIDADRFIKALATTRPELVFTFYGDDEDVKIRYSPDTLFATFGYEIYERKAVRAKGFSREDTFPVSGSLIRDLLARNAPDEAIMSLLPSALSAHDRRAYVSILRGKG